MISRYGIFCKIIETGSFPKTAELLGYSHSDGEPDDQGAGAGDGDNAH